MTHKPRLLVVDDEAGHRMMIRAVMEDEGFEVVESGDGNSCLEFLEREHADVILLDIRMPGLDGMRVLERINRMQIPAQVVMLTAHGSVDSAVEAMKMGAFDYMNKPADIEELKAVLGKAYEQEKAVLEHLPDESRISQLQQEVQLLGESPAMRQLMEKVEQVGPTEVNVLILGESGTGKELVARALHQVSARSSGPLISVNCAALPAELLESELFGYQKGAFTGAVKDKPGKFQLAEKGTLFLDEIGELPLQLQAKLLRALQDKVVHPLGGNREIRVDTRVLAASNKDLAQEAREGRFRQDLYYRLNVVELQVAPLRERPEDIPVLVNHFLRLLAEKNNKRIRGISRDFLEAMRNYHWPGNVRELENTMERAIILARGETLDTRDLPESILQPEEEGLSQESLSSGKSMDEEEKEALEEALKTHQGHREKTARALGISRRSLQYKLKKHGLIKRG